MKTFQYMGYLGNVEYSYADDVWHGSIRDIRDLVTYEAPDLTGLYEEFKSAVDDYLSDCKSKTEKVKTTQLTVKTEKIKHYIVWNHNKTEGYITSDFQIAYEARKGAGANCYTADGNPRHLAIDFCKRYSNEEDCTIEEINL